MASGPIQFSVSTNPIDGLNARLKSLGRKEVITSIKSSPFAGGYNHDICYLNGKGEEWTYGYSQGPADSMDHFAEKFFTHLGAAEQVAKERAAREVCVSPLTNLNARLKSLGRKETVTSINSSSEPQGYINRDIYYRYADGKRSNYKYLQQPTDSPDALAEKFLTHLRDSEYQQYLDDHKAMTLGSLFGENRFPRARERAFLDFRTLAASQTGGSAERFVSPPRKTSDLVCSIPSRYSTLATARGLPTARLGATASR